MARLLGKKVGDVVTEYLGPIVGRNYYSDGVHSVLVAPTVHIQLFGDTTWALTLEENDQFVFRGERASNYGSQAAINLEKIPDPTNWAAVGAAITGGTIVTRAPTVLGNPDPVYLRLVVTTVGTGQANVAVSNHWS